MNEFKDNKDSDPEQAFFFSKESTATAEEIDAELLALAPPPPSLQQAAITGMVMVLSIVILVLFLPDLRFFLQSFQDATPLGESSDVDLSKVNPESWVSLSGIPLMNRTLTFSDGARLFSRDIYRKMAPLSGHPDLLVQWRIENPDIAPSDAAISAPSAFEGRLRRREDMGGAYDKFWPFYDCLTMHTTSRCKYCLGRSDYPSCREVFTCVENFPVELCSEAVSTSLEEVSAEILRLKESLGQPGAPSDTRAELEKKERFGEALSAIRTETRITRLEEFIYRMAYLRLPPTVADKELQIAAEVLKLQVALLGARLSPSIRRMQALPPDAQEAFIRALAEQQTRSARREEQQQIMRVLQPLAEVSGALHRVNVWTVELRQKLRQRSAGDIAKLADWRLDPYTEKGGEILDALGVLGELLSVTVPDATSSAGADLDNEAPSGEPARIDALLQSLGTRISNLGARIDGLAPGENPTFEKWAGRKDIYTEVPPSLRLADVFANLKMAETALADKVPADDDIPLRQRIEAVRAEIEDQEKHLAQLRGMSGLSEYSLTTSFAALEKKTKEPLTPAWKEQIQREWQRIMAEFVAQEYYPGRLTDHPAILRQVDEILDDRRLSDLDAAVTALESKWRRPMWVLMDREKPADNPWVVLVYLVVPMMFALNARRLWLFYLARRR